MSYLLPTISSLNRQGHVPLRRRGPRNESDSSVVCRHDVRRWGGGRCPICYRISIRNYGRNVRRPRQRVVVRPRPEQRAPVVSLGDMIGRLAIDLPGSRVYGSAGDTCIICMSSYENDRVCQQLPCLHRFHTWCYQKWYIRKHDCPVCRRAY